ncbi:MAG: aromatic acid exporter family protein, partial [Eubacterium sp.]|nr:aromatic acid exporter family protein [Eubacterium sp.]
MKKYSSDVLTVIAASVAAILLALLTGAENYISAGIIAILTIQPTKRETLKTA